MNGKYVLLVKKILSDYKKQLFYRALLFRYEWNKSYFLIVTEEIIEDTHLWKSHFMIEKTILLIFYSRFARLEAVIESYPDALEDEDKSLAMMCNSNNSNQFD